MHEPHRVIFVPALATEVYDVKALVLVAGKELLPSTVTLRWSAHTDSSS